MPKPYVLQKLEDLDLYKVDKVDGLGLSSNDYTDTEKEKLAGLQNYTHPSYNEYGVGIYKFSTNTLGHVISATAITKADITNLGIPDQDTTYSDATTTTTGLMTAADKAKLDGIATGAQVNVLPDWNATSGTSRILNRPNLAVVATSGLYSDLSGTPTLAKVATSGVYGDLTDTPDLKAVATSGLYSDLTGIPVLALVATTGLYSDLIGTPILSNVATSGKYEDLSGIPLLAEVAISGSYADLLNKPELKAVATSGSYIDLTNKPTLSAVAATGAYSDLTGTPILAAVATSGSYNDLSNKPTIPVVNISTNITTDATSDTKVTSPKAVKTYVDGLISTVFKPSGSITFESLPAPSASVLGNVYNITNDFTTTSSFLEGAGNSCKAGSNVVIVQSGTSYMYDILGGFVDLSAYVEEAELIEYSATEIQTMWNSVFNV